MECLPSEEYNRRLKELYEKGNIEEILAFERNYSEIIYEPLSKEHIEAIKARKILVR